MRIRGRAAKGAILLIALIGLLVPVASAGPAPAFPEGEWEATTRIAGWQVRDDAVWSGHFGINFSVVASVDSASGEFRSSGDSNVTVPQGRIEMHSFAHGELFGSPSLLAAIGISENNGIGYFAGRDVPMEGSGPVGSVSIEVEFARCHEVQGTWTQSLTELLEELGWAPSLTGGFVAHGVPEFLPAHLENLKGRLLDLTSKFDAVFDDFIDEEGIQWSQLRALIDEAVALENELANLHECEQKQIGDEIRELGAFFYAPGYVIQGLIKIAIGGPEFEGIDLDARQIIWLTDFALETGLIGPGAPDQADAQLWEIELKSLTRAERDEALGTVQAAEGVLAEGNELTPEAEQQYGDALIEWASLSAHIEAMGWDDAGS
jgi:hypothetical protein